MYPGTYAQSHPDKPAYIMASTGETVTYAELDRDSMKIAQLFRSRGLEPESGVALFLTNHSSFFKIAWAAQRSALRYTAINYHLTAEEAEYIVRDCGAKALLITGHKPDVARELRERLSDLHLFSVDGEIEGYEDLDEAIADLPAEPVDEEGEGVQMLYSSGTTGRPKGVRRPMTRLPMGTQPELFEYFVARYQVALDSVYLSPAPLYHAAPLAFNLGFQRMGATCILMERFDELESLRLIEKHSVTHSQWVPTMFVRMLKLPQDEREQFDLSTLQFAVHAAAPCPIPVKEQMIDWWGPVLYEYYAGTEGNGSTSIDSHEWLEHKGSVGMPQNVEIYICDDDGNEVAQGEPGLVYFGGGGEFTYHNDPEKTAGSRHPAGWTTLGDVGYLDEDGYLYLTDRKAYMIIRGGVNIYPQEAENVLITHPKVYDCAVVGVPHEEFGEEVKGVVQPMPGHEPSAELEAELLAWCTSKLAKFKCPASIDFEEELPRHPTGKLYKRLIKDRYWGKKDTRIV
ncbi:MAG: AMP-binding protein [Acidobacteriota bacterium]